jgi:hypothetical protein
MTVIAYAYNADHHCKSCTYSYARSVPFAEYDWQNDKYSEEDIEGIQPGLLNMQKAIELEIIKDGEGNPIHPVFSIDEWYNIGEGDQVLACTDCGTELDRYWESDGN